MTGFAYCHDFGMGSGVVGGANFIAAFPYYTSVKDNDSAKGPANIIPYPVKGFFKSQFHIFVVLLCHKE